MITIARKPTHSGEVLREEFLPDYGLSVIALASRLGVSRQPINELVRELRALSTDMAVRLTKAFDTSPHYWLNMQRNFDIWETMGKGGGELLPVKPLSA